MSVICIELVKLLDWSEPRPRRVIELIGNYIVKTVQNYENELPKTNVSQWKNTSSLKNAIFFE